MRLLTTIYRFHPPLPPEFSHTYLFYFAPRNSSPAFRFQRDWRAEGDQRINDINEQFEQISTGPARNLILFIADGNGINTNYGTRLFQGQMNGGYGDEFELSHEK